MSSGSLTVSELGVADSTELTVSFWDPADASVAPVVVSASSSGDDLTVSVPDFQNALVVVVGVPEPAVALQGIAALAAVALVRRRKRRGSY